MTELAANFKNPRGTTEIYLVNETGKILFATPGRSISNLNEFFDKEILSMIHSTEFHDFTKETRSTTGVAWLASGVKIPVGNWSILSLVDKKQALSAVELYNATRQVIQGNFNIQVDIKSQDEIGSLGKSFNIMATEVARLIIETAEKSRMETELKTAKTVQETLFPSTEAQIGQMQ